jgi:LysR family transcriptional activator of glutamate synthase operon
MEIGYLREFVVLAQTGNFLEAADILYSSQSALSKHIKSMELELSVPLFDRTTRKVRVSKFGQLLLPYAKQITELQDKYTAILQSSLETDKEILTLGSIYGLAQYKITDVLVNFKKSRPHSTLNMMQASSKDLTDMLRQGKCELAFIRDIVDVDDEFVKIPYFTDTIVAVLPITHPLAKKKTIPLQMLADENFLLALPGTMPYRLSMKACEQSGFEPRVAYNDPELENHIDLVIQGMGVSLALKQLVLYHSHPKIAIVDITPSVTTEICLCYPKSVKLSDAAKHFMQCTGSQRGMVE